MVFPLHGIECRLKYSCAVGLCASAQTLFFFFFLPVIVGFGAFKAQLGISTERVVLFDAEICHCVSV